MSTLLIRADANAEIGSGHIMRGLALAQAWQDIGGRASFCASGPPISLHARLESENCQVRYLKDVTAGSEEDARQTIALANEAGASWVVVDGYHFSSTFQTALVQAGIRVCFVDDHGHGAPYEADIVLNQNVTANARLYANRSSRTQLLLGPTYALLRREFREHRVPQRFEPPRARRILLTLGGSDPDNATLAVLRALSLIDCADMHIVAVIGPLCLHKTAIAAGIRDLPINVELQENVSNMPQLMSAADLIIAAPGSTTWECYALGIPAILVVLAENQVAVAAECERLGLARSLGWGRALDDCAAAKTIRELLSDQAARDRMSKQSRQLVDGGGAPRVVSRLTSFANSEPNEEEAPNAVA